MTTISFAGDWALDVDVTILRPVVVDNRYGSSERSWESPAQTVTRGLLQQSSSQETHSETRDEVRVQALLFLPAGTQIASADRVMVAGQTWFVSGAPLRPGRPGQPEHHVECQIVLIWDGA